MQGYQIKKLPFHLLFLFSILILIAPNPNSASWIIINDDGSTKVYSPKEEPYIAPVHKREITKKITSNLKQNHKKVDEKIIYLTFDDGPLLGSNNIISVLQDENVKATMFMVGKHIQKSKYRKKIFQRAIKEPLILVANHTYSHANGRYRDFYSDTNRVLSDMQRMDDILFENDLNYIIPYSRLAGRNVFRLPQIKLDDPMIQKKQKESEKYNALWDEGYYIYGWDYQWAYDPKSGKVYKSPHKLTQIIERIHKRGKTKIKGKFILLLHDFSFRNKFDGKETLRTLVQELKILGWKFETIETYLDN